MRKLMKVEVMFLVLAVLLIGVSARADVVDQGGGSQYTEEWKVNPAARWGGKTTQVLVLAAAGGVTTPATQLSGRKAVEIQNLGPNPIFCTVDGQAPVVNSLGRRIDSFGSWALDIGSVIILKCITSVDQLTGAATMVTELK